MMNSPVSYMGNNPIRDQIRQWIVDSYYSSPDPIDEFVPYDGKNGYAIPRNGSELNLTGEDTFDFN